MPSTKRDRGFSLRPHFTPLARLSLAVRILTVLVLVLPPLLYIAAFGLAIGAARTPDFVAADRLSVGPPDAPTTGLPLNASQHASPWYACTPHSGNATDPFYFSETCAPRYGDALSLPACRARLAGDYANKQCEGVVRAAQLYTAGQVLVMLAFACAAAYSVLVAVRLGAGPRYYYYYHGVVVRRRGAGGEAAAGEGEEVNETEAETETRLRTAALNNALGSLATLLALGAAACLALGQLQAYSTMVVEASDEAMLGTGQDATRWYMSKGLGALTGAAYALALAGAFISLSRCGLPW